MDFKVTPLTTRKSSRGMSFLLERRLSQSPRSGVIDMLDFGKVDEKKEVS